MQRNMNAVPMKMKKEENKDFNHEISNINSCDSICFQSRRNIL